MNTFINNIAQSLAAAHEMMIMETSIKWDQFKHMYVGYVELVPDNYGLGECKEEDIIEYQIYSDGRFEKL